MAWGLKASFFGSLLRPVSTIWGGIQYSAIVKLTRLKIFKPPPLKNSLGRQLKQIGIFAYGGQVGKCAEVLGVTPLFLIAIDIRKKTPKKIHDHEPKCTKSI